MKKSLLYFLFFSLISCTQNADFKKEISKITNGKNATIAVSISGIDFPFEFHNENALKKLPMQSVFKFHIALAVLDLVDKGKLSLDQKVFVKKSELLPNTWSPIREKNPEGNFEMPISELLEYTVAMSDNVGCDVLLRLIGGPITVHNYLISKGVKNTQIVYNEEIMQSAWKNQYENFTTAKSASKLLKNFYQGEILSKKSTQFLLGVMYRTSTGLNKIVEQLPKSSKVAHKTGSSGQNDDGLIGAENDIAIVTLPNGKRYVIAIFVSNSKENYDDTCMVISDISKVVYENFKTL